MLLFSTILEISEKMTKDAFIQMVIDWNQNGHPDSRIEGIKWTGEYNIRYEDENKWLDIKEYRNKNIVAARYEKQEEDGTVWDTDYIMNFHEMKMAVRLDRSYKDAAGDANAKFFTPYFISMLIDRGYLKKDGDFEIQRYPMMVDENSLDIIASIVNGTATHRLPIVLVSKTFSNENPLDVAFLTKALKGLAHVIVQKDCRTSAKLRELCDGKNEYNGAIGLYYPNAKIGYRRYLYKSVEVRQRLISDKIIKSVMQYNNAQMIDPLYTWYGVNNELLQDKLIKKKHEKRKIEAEKRHALCFMELLGFDRKLEINSIKREMQMKQKSKIEKLKKEFQKEADEKIDRKINEYVEVFGEELDKKDEIIKNLSSELAKKEQEVAYLKAKLDSNTEVPVIVEGEEEEFYPGEIKDFVLAAVEKELNNTEPRTRRHDILSDILRNNEYLAVGKEKAEKVRQLLNDYTGMNSRMKKEFENLGFEVEDTNHPKLRYYGDSRYTVVYGSTPSDKGHGGKNNARITIKKAF